MCQMDWLALFPDSLETTQLQRFSTKSKGRSCRELTPFRQMSNALTLCEAFKGIVASDQTYIESSCNQLRGLAIAGIRGAGWSTKLNF